MGYSTASSIYIMLPGILTNTANNTLIAQYDTRVKGKINNFLSKRYDVSGWTSGTAIPPGITKISDDLVAMWTVRSLYVEAKRSHGWILEVGEQALEDLKALAKGEIALADNDGNLISTRKKGQSTTEDYYPVFDLDESYDWEVDPDQLTQISSDRE